MWVDKMVFVLACEVGDLILSLHFIYDDCYRQSRNDVLDNFGVVLSTYWFPEACAKFSILRLVSLLGLLLVFYKRKYANLIIDGCLLRRNFIFDE